MAMICLFLLILEIICNEAATNTDLSCFSCCSLDQTPYRSRYGGDLQLVPAEVCGPGFVDVSSRSPAANKIMFEKLISCNEIAVSRDGDKRKSGYCVKVVGYEMETNSNVTARGCYDGTFIADRARYDSRAIKFGKWKIRGTIHFCDSIGCNSGSSLFSRMTELAVAVSMAKKLIN